MLNWNKIKCLALDVDGVMTDGRISQGPNGEWIRSFYIRDGLGLLQLQKYGFKTAIITSSDAADIKVRAKNLKIDYFFDGQKDKADAFLKLQQQSSLKSFEIAFMGDDIIDLPVFETCGLTMAPADAHALVLARAQFVSKFNGGSGAVREACDLLIQNCSNSRISI